MAFQADAAVSPQVGRDPRVLVVYENFAVGTAVFQRLVDHYAVVELARLEGALRRLGERGRYEAVVLCPYLSDDAREDVRRRCLADPATPVIIEVVDDEAGAHVVSSADGFEPMVQALASPNQLSDARAMGGEIGGLAH
jgi:hypothetical protein